MTYSGNRRAGSGVAMLLVGASMYALAGVLPAMAQTAQTTGVTGNPVSTGDATGTSRAGGSTVSSTAPSTDDAIVVTGIRRANANAIAIKRNSDTVVDAISAEDIGALPDKSITETLQRIPGVAINHFAAINDPDHVSEEGQSPVIRGLPYVNSQFNGRDAFTANRGRALNFQDIPPDLAATVEVYKNQTADQIEGGIAGIINIVTRRPLDTKNNYFVLNADMNYGDLRNSATPEISGLLSHQWDTDIGRFGVLASASYSAIEEQVDNARITTYRDYRRGILNPGYVASTPDYVRNPDGTIKRDPKTNNPVGVDYINPDGSISATDACTTGAPYSALPSSTVGFPGARQPGANQCSINQGLTGATPNTDYYVPLGGGYSRQDNDRKRIGLSAAAQYESPDQRLLATLQYIHSNTIQTYTERTIAPVEDTGNIDIVGGVSAGTFDANNVLTRGTLSSAGGGGIDTQELNRGERLRSTTDDYSAHLQWKPIDRLHIDFDTQYATSSSYTLDTSTVAIASTIQTIDSTRSVPQISFAQPAFFTGGVKDPVHQFTGDYSGTNGVGYYGAGSSPTADPNLTFWRSAQDHQDNTGGNEFAFRADGVYDVGDGLLKRVKFGARYADRKQTIRSDGYNWGNLSERWHGGITTPAEITPTGFGTIGLGSFFRGASPQNLTIFGLLDNPAVAYNQLQAGAFAIKQFRGNNGSGGGYYFPLYTGVRNGSAANAAAAASIANGAGDGFHTLGELSTNDEETIAGYGRIDFAVPASITGVLKIDGNIGLRYIHTNSSSFGYYAVPSVQSVFVQSGGAPVTAANFTCTPGYTPPPVSGTPGYNICNNTEAFRKALFTFLGDNNTYTPNTTSQGYNDFLPSFNLRVAPTEKLQFRFAYSKGITRPSFNDLRNYTLFSVPGPIGTIPLNTPYPDIALKAASYGNPLLRPTKSDNIDLTGEWYYAPQGSFTLGLFYKQLKNVTSVLNGISGSNGSGSNPLENGTVSNNIGVDPANPSVIAYTNNGVTLNANNSLIVNNNRTVDVKGIELDFRQGNFSFLPSPLDGLGVSANFTYIDADKLRFQSVLAANYDSNTGGYNPKTGYLTSFAFPGVSKYNANAELFYEKYGIQARVAYSWRSKYFVTSQDSLGPNDPTYTGSAGFMDASLFYAVDKHLKIGATGSNLLNETVSTYNQITQSGIRALRGINQQDRRFTLGVRMGF